MRTAIVYDRINKWGGAERVLLSLHKIFPEAILFTSVYNPKTAAWAKVFPQIKTSFLQGFPFARGNHEYFAPLMPLAFESLDLTGFDLVISVTSEAAKGVITKPGTSHLCYCLTPTRYLWSGYGLYFKNPILRFFAQPIVRYLKKWDCFAAQRPDIMVGISKEVQGRIKKYYNRDSIVIHPPLTLNKQNSNIKTTKENYYLMVGRLVAYKKTDLVIKVFNRLKLPLIIVGEGSQKKSLQKMAKSNIKFYENLSNEKLAEIYAKAKALIMPQEEDFGLVSLEAQAFGTPVIAYKKGGALDTVVDSETGILFENQSEESLTDAIRKFNLMKFNQEKLIKNSQCFSEEVFKQRLLSIIKDNLKK